MSKRKTYTIASLREQIVTLFLIFFLFSGCLTEWQDQSGIAVRKTSAIGALADNYPRLETESARIRQTMVPEDSQSAGTAVVQMIATDWGMINTQVARVFNLPEAIPTAKAPAMDYFALGDSLASGYGLGDDGQPCHRSIRSYPYKVAQHLQAFYDKVYFRHLACSGATINTPEEDLLKKDSNKWFRNQVDATLRNLSPDKPTLITITIGANDAQWSDILALAPHLIEFGDTYLAWANSVKHTISTELLTQIPRLINDHPNVTVLITEIYNPFNKESNFFLGIGPFQACEDMLSTLDCYERTHYLVSAINNGFVLDVYIPLGRPERLRIIPIESVFAGHEAPSPMCGNAAPVISELNLLQQFLSTVGIDTDTEDSGTWIQYPGDPASNAALPPLPSFSTNTARIYGDCLHPNEKGAIAIAGEIEYTLKMMGNK